jgi:hypothetical protein
MRGAHKLHRKGRHHEGRMGPGGRNKWLTVVGALRGAGARGKSVACLAGEGFLLRMLHLRRFTEAAGALPRTGRNSLTASRLIRHISNSSHSNSSTTILPTYFMAQPLSATPPLRIPNRPTDLSTYNTCLRIEKSLQTTVNNVRKVADDLIYIRILGYLIHYVVSDHGLATVMKEIDSAADDNALLQVGRKYFEHYIRACKFASLLVQCAIWRSHPVTTRGLTPRPSNHPSPPSFDTIADMVNDTLNAAPHDHKKARKLVGHFLYFHE